ncbi:MAG: hypothetical protein ACREH8_06335 [Opitutaceae bacterium]
MKPFLHGKKCLDMSALRPPNVLASRRPVPAGEVGGPASAITPGASNAHVEIVQEGGKVVRLIVTCVCGEKVEIECLYSAGS